MLGIIARCDNSGLGNQTRNLVRMLNPDKVMVINFKKYSGMKQYPERYAEYNTMTVNGFASDEQVKEFLKGLDSVITCEIFYNDKFIKLAKEAGVKTYNQYNYEFFDNFQNPNLLRPTELLSPSSWHYIDMIEKGYDIVYLPPPTFENDFTEVRNINIKRNGKPRFLHVVGRQAVHNRNGTDTIHKAMQFSTGDFDLVIKSQNPIAEIKDDRVIYDYSNPESNVDLYKDFDLMIMPRKYGGLCLPMNEALMAGLPVIMTDVAPNNDVLPKEWLIPAKKVGEFMTRTMIDIHEADEILLADRLDFLSEHLPDKLSAFNIGVNNFSDKILIDNYKDLLE